MVTILTPEISERVERLDPDALVIHLGPLSQQLSEDEFFEFCAANRELRIEMTKEGDMIIMLPVGSEGGHRNFNLTGEFFAWAKVDQTGMGFDSSTGFILPNGAKRSPDLSWIRLDRWQAVPEKKRKKFAPICPDFVVELRPETDKLPILKLKMEEYSENGAQLGWLINPLEKRVYIYRPDEPVEMLEQPTELSGEPLLKGFTLNLKGILT